MTNLVAQKEIPLGNPLRGFGPFGLEGKGSEEAPSIFNQFLSSTIGLMTIIAIIWFIFLLLSGAYGIMNAGSDKGALETARKRITSGLIGIIVVIAAIFIIDLIGNLIGIKNILNPAELLNQITQ